MWVNAATQLCLNGEGIGEARLTRREQAVFQVSLFGLPHPLVWAGEGQPLVKQRQHRGCPLGQTGVGRVDLREVVDVAEKMRPTALVNARIMMVRRVEITD